MLQHYQTARESTDGLARARINRSTAAKMPLPPYPSSRDPSKFYPFKKQMLAAFDAVELALIITAVVTRDGPNPAAAPAVH